MHNLKTSWPPAIPHGAGPGPWHVLARLNSLLTTDAPEAGLLEGFLRAFHELPEITASWIGQPNAAGILQPAAWHGEVTPAATITRAAALNCPSREAARLLVPVYVDDWRDHTNANLRAMAARHGWRAGLALPIPSCAMPGAGAKPHILVAESRQPFFFSQTLPRHVLSHIAAIIAAALAAQAAREAARRAEKLYHTLFEAAGLLVAARQESKLLRRLCECLVGSGQIVAAAIIQPDERNVWHDRGAANSQAVQRLRAITAAHQPGTPKPPLTVLAWTARKSMVANSYLTDPRFSPYHETARALGIEAVAAIVIRRGQSRWGVLLVDAARAGYFDAQIISLLERLSGMIGQRLNEFDTKSVLAAERQAQNLAARRDELTFLPNLLALSEQLPGLLTRAAARGATTAIIRLDIDGLKELNQQWGRTAGDAVLSAYADRLRGLARQNGLLARAGSDEFVIIADLPAGAAAIPAFAAKLQKAVAAPVLLPGGQKLDVTHSIGITLCPQDGTLPVELFEQAQTALLAARASKTATGQSWRLYQDVIPTENPPGRILAGLAGGAVRVHYQPVLELHSGKIISVEALARLEDAGRLRTPDEFLPGLLMDGRLTLFHQVLAAALAQLAAWDAQGLCLNVSVNIDAPVLLLEDTLPGVRAALDRAGIAPSRLVLEILETHEFLDFARAREKITGFRQAGIRLALDDLGAGYASLLKIRELPLDMVKLDRAFVAGLREQPDDLQFVAAFQTLAASRHIALVVEGVESDDVLDALRMIGVRLAQGFLIARPMRGADLATWLRARATVPTTSQPRTLLGAYALHLAWLRAFNAARGRDGLLNFLQASNAFSLDGFFAARQHRGLLDEAYKSLRGQLSDTAADRARIRDAATGFRARLMAALREQGQ